MNKLLRLCLLLTQLFSCSPEGGYISTTHVGGHYEGFGSIVRGTFLPLLQLSIESGLNIVLHEEFFWGKNTRNYTTLNFRDFFKLSSCTLNDIESHPEVNIVSLRAFDYKYSDEKMNDLRRYIKAQSKLLPKRYKVFLILLRGNPPRHLSLNVWKQPFDASSWLRDRTKFHENRGGSSLSIAFHIRRGDAQEDRKSHISYFIGIGLKMKLWSSPPFRIRVFTESGFSIEERSIFQKTFPRSKIIEGNDETLFNDVKRMAAADIFITSPRSRLSSLVAHLCSPKAIKIVDSSDDRSLYAGMLNVLFSEDLSKLRYQKLLRSSNFNSKKEL